MSNGPISQARAAAAVPASSTADVNRICMIVGAPEGLPSYCGRARRLHHTAAAWSGVTCADCRAAARADGLRVPVEIPKVVKP
jgi:hypothetical protein